MGTVFLLLLMNEISFYFTSVCYNFDFVKTCFFSCDNFSVRTSRIISTIDEIKANTRLTPPWLLVSFPRAISTASEFFV